MSNNKSNFINKLKDTKINLYNNNNASFINSFNNIDNALQIHQIDIDKLIPAPDEWNFYSSLSDDKMDELVISILENNLLHPIIVWEKENDTYMILAGHNRKRAFEIIYENTRNEKFKKISAIVKKKNEIDKEQAQEIIIDTNWVQRQLNTVEKARSIMYKYVLLGRKKYSKEGDYTRDLIAKDYGISGRQVTNYYRLNFLIKEIQEMLNTNLISIKSGVIISKFNKHMQKWMYDNFRDKLDNKKIANLKEEMNREDIKKILLENEIDNVKIIIDIPRCLKDEFEVMVNSWMKKNLGT